MDWAVEQAKKLADAERAESDRRQLELPADDN